MDPIKLMPTMTDDEVKLVSNTLEEIRKENDSISDDDNSNDTIETGETRLVNTTIDSSTGLPIITNTEEVEVNDPDLLDLINDSEINLDFDQSPISIDEIKKFLENSKDDPMFKDKLDETGLPLEDLEVLFNLITKYQNKEKISSLFNKLPKSCQDIITSSIGSGFENNHSNQSNNLKNNLAELFLDQFISSIMMDRASHSINSSIEKVFNKATTEIGDTIVGYTEERNEKIRKQIEEEVTDPEKKEEALKLLDYINTAYELTDLKEYCKKCKIRKIDIENPDRTDNKDINHILDLYNNSNDFNIYNIYTAQAALERNLPTEEEPYTATHCRAFLVAFSKYCMNFSPNNTYEHIFMFYTIYNILLTDVNKGEKAEVSNKFLDNVRECIRNLIQRNDYLSLK